MPRAPRRTKHPLLLTLRQELATLADPVRAKSAQAYMKSEMPFYGIPAPQLRALSKRLFATQKFSSAEEFREATLAVWRSATHREERYAAIELTGLRAVRPYQTLDTLPMYEELIVTGAWWDYVDVIATHRLGGLLRAFPETMPGTMLEWSRSDDLWKRRSAIICQLTFKQETDLKLLYACIQPALSSKEFFLRKAIGWALRQVAWTNPREVIRYVRAHREQLSGLSKREALKNVIKSGLIAEIP
jgi:3-methyladenine DNA glycosylase AlkD